MKRKMALIMVLLLNAGLMLSGCSIGEANKSISTGYKITQKIKIEFWHSLGILNMQVIKDLVEEFNRSHPEVEVVETCQGSYDETTNKLYSAIAAGNAPDVSMLERSYVANFVASNMLEDLKPYADRDKVDLKDFFVELMGHSSYDNRLVSLPLNRSTPILLYNKKHFKEVGLDPQNGPKNWEELKAFARKLTVKDVRAGYEMPIEVWYFKAFVAQYGGRTLTEDRKNIGFNNESGVGTLEYWRSMRAEGIMKIPRPDDAGNDAARVCRSDYMNEKASMIINSSADLSSILKQVQDKFEVGVCFLPANKKYSVPTGGANISILSGSTGEKKEAGWKFAKWLTDTKQVVYFSVNTGYVPTRKSAIDTDEIKKLYQEKPQFRVAVDQLQFAVDTESAVNWLKVKMEILDGIETFMNEENASARQTVEDIEAKAKKILAQ